MGVSMCSQVCNRKAVHNVYDVPVTDVWDTTDEDSIDDKDWHLNNPMPKKSFSMPLDYHEVLEEVSTIKRAKSGQLLRSSGYSLQDRMKDRSRSSVVDREMESTAKRYCKMVREDSMRSLHQTISVASSIVEKGSDINKELARQEQVISMAETDISIAEFDIDEVTDVLKGMSSLRGKLSSVLKKKKPKLKVTPPRNMDMNLMNGEVGLFSFSKISTPESSSPSKGSEEDTHQKRIMEGIGHLNQALDAIAVQQLDTAMTLDRNEEGLSVFEDQMTRTHQKIKSQSKMMNKIMGKA